MLHFRPFIYCFNRSAYGEPLTPSPFEKPLFIWRTLLSLSHPSSPNHSHTLPVLPPTDHPQDLQPPLLHCLGVSPINLHLPSIRCFKKDLILCLKHELKIIFKYLAHKTLPYKEQHKFHCQQCQTATKINEQVACTQFVRNYQPSLQNCNSYGHYYCSPS